MNKGAKSLYTAITSLIYTLVYGILGLIVIRLVITNYGSDFNGINSTANQFVGILMILEGGFTLAINVALFKPITDGDHTRINNILSAAKIIFNKVGAAVLIIGVIASIAYSLIIKSDLSWMIAALTFIMTVVSAAFNLSFATKYSLLLQSEQREYILNSIKIITTLVAQFLIVLVVMIHAHMLWVRFATMAGAILNSLIIGFTCRRRYHFLRFDQSPDYNSIKGTRDILAQKITNMIYGMVPIVFVSASVGTLYASVYAVYSSVFMLLKSTINGFIGAPRMGFGQLIVEKDNDYVKQVFLQYEFIIMVVMLCLLSTTTVLIMPFINLYTSGVSDIEYKNWIIAGLFIAIAFFEITHVPSGTIINMAGHFKVSKVFQITACTILIILMIVGNYMLGFYGIIAAVLVTAIVLAVLEIRYIHMKYFPKILSQFLVFFMSNLLFIGLVVYAELSIIPEITTLKCFIFIGAILLILNSLLLIAFNYLANKQIFMDVYHRLKPMTTNLYQLLHQLVFKSRY